MAQAAVNLLLATDGSEFSEGAVREAIKLAKTCSTKLYAFSVVQTNPEFEAMAPAVVEKAEAETRKTLDAVKERASAEGVDCEIAAMHEEEPYRAIISEAEKINAGMIIMGRRGRKGLARLMMGSNTARVIGHAHCNVLVVPRAAAPRYETILVPVDTSVYSERAVSEAINLAGMCGGSLIVMSVLQVEGYELDYSSLKQIDKVAQREASEVEEFIRKIKEKAEAEGVKSEGLIMTGKPYEAILQVAEDRKADLIVMGSHGRTGLGKVMMGSVAERVITLSPCAVMVVKK
jgi:hypothetical protein